ncbi:MAG: hypothetical protein KKH01_05420 [Firmicutes bacterium]|nr:hypothetical protein [Bacillota bacterium]
MMIYIKRFYLSLIALVFIVVIFGTVTYAWISMASVNSLDGMSLTATSGNELLISIDGINYSRELPSAALEQLLEQVALTDVTSTDGIHFNRGGLNVGELVIPNQHFVSFELWLQTDRPEHNIYLVENVNHLVSYDSTFSGTYVVSHGVTWTSDYNFINGPSLNDIVEKNEENIYFASDAVRISFQEIKDLDNVLDVRNSDEMHTFLYDPSENEERGYGVSFGAFSYFLVSAQVPIEIPLEAQDVQYHLSTFNPDNPYEAVDDTSLIATLQESEATSMSGKTLYRGKIVINIWIEGWDADAFNSILNDRIKIQLKFKAAKSSNQYE